MTSETPFQEVDALPPDERLPGLALLLDPEAVGARMGANLASGHKLVGACRARYVRYKPGTSALVAYSLLVRDPEGDEPRETWVYGKSYSSGRYDAAAGKARDRGWAEVPGWPPVVAVPELSTIFYVFPNDQEMPGLRLLASRKRVRRLVAASLPWYRDEEWRISDKKLRQGVVRYKPEKRAVVRVATRAVHRESGERDPLCVYVRGYTGNRDVAAARALRRLWERFHGCSSLRVPRLLLHRRDARMLFVEGLDGTPLDRTLANAPAEAIASVAWHLWLLHRSCDGAVQHRRVADVLREARAAARAIAAMAPELGPRAAALLERIMARTPADPEPTRWVHGDFHPGQVLLQPNDVVAFLDFDRSHRGDPFEDVGNFVAHLRLAARAGVVTPRAETVFVDAYAGATAQQLEAERLRFWTAQALLRLALRTFRELQAGWKAETVAALDLCEELLA